MAYARIFRTYGGDDARAVGADQTGLVLGPENIGDADHVWEAGLARIQLEMQQR